MNSKDKTNNQRVQNVEVTKASNGLNLYYELDGKSVNVTGDFYIDDKNILHHTAIDDEENEIEIKVEIEY